MLIKDINPDAQSMNLDSNLFYNHAYGSRNAIVKDSNTLDLIIDLPCLEACKYLYDCNILTTNSSANKTNKNSGFITILFSSLSDENKKVLDDLVLKGLVQLREDFDKNNNNESFMIEVPIKENTTVEEFYNQMLTIVKNFLPQEINYGYYTKEKFGNLVIEKFSNVILSDGTPFWKMIMQKINQGEIPTTTDGEVEFADGKCIAFETLCLEYANEFGYYYDINEEKYWIDKEPVGIENIQDIFVVNSQFYKNLKNKKMII